MHFALLTIAEYKAMLKNTLKQFARGLKLHISALYLASKDPAVPEMAKWLGIAVVVYALSPVDLIPDFIPVIGYLDELLILPLGIYLAVKLIPEEVWADCLTKAAMKPIQLPENRYAAVAIICCWLLFSAVLTYAVWSLFYQ